MAWYVPFNKLSQQQLQAINTVEREPKRALWLQGFAGSGKTVVMTNILERTAAAHPQASLAFITYTHALKQMVGTGFSGAARDRVVIQTHTQFLADKKRYDHVFLDEVQDIKAADLQKIKELSGSLRIAGDPDQRIYTHGSSATEIQRTTDALIWKLSEIFRLTARLCKLAVSIFPSSRVVEGEVRNAKPNPTIKLFSFSSAGAESHWTYNEAKGRSKAGAPSVILLPTHNAIYDFAKDVALKAGIGYPPRARKLYGKMNYEEFNDFFESANFELEYFGNDNGNLAESDTSSKVYLMTYHSAKGLDFKNVFIPGLNRGYRLVPELSLKDDPDLEGRLLYVAVTRSRENLFLSYNAGQPHALLSKLPAEIVTEVNPVATTAPADDEEEFF
jgi:superfamily I DNA/RNA helicase